MKLNLKINFPQNYFPALLRWQTPRTKIFYLYSPDPGPTFRENILLIIKFLRFFSLFSFISEQLTPCVTSA